MPRKHHREGKPTVHQAVGRRPRISWAPSMHFQPRGNHVLPRNRRSDARLVIAVLNTDATTYEDLFDFVQFGHNDKVPLKEEQYTSEAQFKANLKKSSNRPVNTGQRRCYSHHCTPLGTNQKSHEGYHRHMMCRSSTSMRRASRFA